MAWDDSGRPAFSTPAAVNAGGGLIPQRNGRGFSRRTLYIHNFCDVTVTFALVATFADGLFLLVQGTVAAGIFAVITQGGSGSGVFTVTAGSLGAMGAAADLVGVFVTAGAGATAGGVAAQLWQDG